MEERKQHIIENVARIYLKHGIRNVTLDNVASELGISKKTLYQNFTDKKDLVARVVDYFIDDAEYEFKRSKYGNAIDNMFLIRKHVAFILKFYNNRIEHDLKKSYPELYEKIRKIKRQRIFDNTIENIKQGMEEKLYRNDLDSYFIAKLQLGRMLYTLNPDYQIFEEYELNSIAFFDSMMDYHMNAICTEKGMKYYKKQLNKVQNES